MKSPQTSTPPGGPQEPAARRRRWPWLLVGGLLLALVLGRALLLRGLAGLLISDEPDPGATAVVLLSGDRVHEVIAGRVRDGEGVEVLLIEPAPQRLESFGLVPRHAEADRLALEARGVPAPAIRILPGAARDDWGAVRVLGGWLRDHPEERVVLLCDRFGSRRLRIILNRVLGPSGPRAHVAALPDRRFDETNWWQSKDGVVSCWNGFTRLTYVWLAGESDPPAPDWDPDAYERALR